MSSTYTVKFDTQPGTKRGAGWCVQRNGSTVMEFGADHQGREAAERRARLFNAAEEGPEAEAALWNAEFAERAARSQAARHRAASRRR